jgi:hypothetical protein
MICTMKCENCNTDNIGLGAVSIIVNLQKSKWCEHCYENKQDKHPLLFCKPECMKDYFSSRSKLQLFDKLIGYFKDGKTYEFYSETAPIHPFLEVEEELLMAEPVEEPKKNSHVEDYVLLMLGAPVVKVELDPQQLAFCVQQAEAVIMAYEQMPQTSRKIPDKVMADLLNRGALAFAKLILGRIRSKYKNVPGPSGDVCLDGSVLLREGKEDLVEFEQYIAWGLGFPEDCEHE